MEGSSGDPSTSVPNTASSCESSFCSMVAHGRGVFSDRVDPHEVGAHWYAKQRRMVDRCLEVRSGNNEQCFIDVGYAATDGIMHSGIGPFDIASGASMSSVKVDWNKRAARATFFVNSLDGDASNLLSRGLDGRAIEFAFATLRGPVDAFFDGVMVLAEDKIVRRNRMALLEHIAMLFGKFADFSKISP